MKRALVTIMLIALTVGASAARTISTGEVQRLLETEPSATECARTCSSASS